MPNVFVEKHTHQISNFFKPVEYVVNDFEQNKNESQQIENESLQTENQVLNYDESSENESVDNSDEFDVLKIKRNNPLLVKHFLLHQNEIIDQIANFPKLNKKK